MRFSVAIVGRANVGKSTLFNRLIGRRSALVDDQPGVTRDRREGEARLGDLEFTAIDTAGIEDADPDSLTGRMRAQTETAIASADAVMFLMDARAGVMPSDRVIAQLVRAEIRQARDPRRQQERRAGEVNQGVYEAYGLGLGDPIPLSAEHGDGFADLYDALCAALPARPEVDEPVDEGGRRRGGGRRARGRSASPSSAGRTRASRRWSTG